MIYWIIAWFIVGFVFALHDLRQADNSYQFTILGLIVRSGIGFIAPLLILSYYIGVFMTKEHSVLSKSKEDMEEIIKEMTKEVEALDKRQEKVEKDNLKRKQKKTKEI